MKNNIYHARIIKELNKKVPQRTKLVSILTELLEIEKEAVYRRLRGEVPFSFSEVAILSQKLSLSIDEIIGSSVTGVTQFRLRMMEFNDLNDVDYNFMEQLTRFIDFVNGPETEAAESINVLPKTMYFKFENIIRFYLFKCIYQSESSSKSTLFKEVSITEKGKQVYQNYLNAAHKVGKTKYVLDFKIFEYLVNDIRYFKSIGLIDAEDIACLKKDLLSLLNYFEEMTISGVFPETSNKVQFYISNMNFECGYSYIKTTAYSISFIKTFILNSVVSFDNNTYLKLNKWIQSQIKSSTLITESGEMDRIKFFQQQYQLIEGLI